MKCYIDDFFKRNLEYRVYDLAVYCNVTPQYIYNILDSRASPRIDLAYKILFFFRNLDSNVEYDLKDFWH